MATARRRRPGFGKTISQGFKPKAKRGSPAGSGRSNASRRGAAGRASVNGSAPAPGVGEPALLKRREELSTQFTQLQWDLGGMTYEMASRDHYRLDVLNKHAAELQQVDAELGQIERVLRMEEAGAAGTCPSCGALQARGAVFCWQCGNELKPPTAPETKAQPAAGQ